MKVCVVGAGNIGSILLNDLSQNSSLRVIALIRDEHKLSDTIDKKVGNSIIKGHNIEVTENPKTAFDGASIVIFTLPSNIIHLKSDNYFPHIETGCMVLFIPGTGGIEFIAHKLVNKNAKVFGVQRVHAISRLINYGSLVEELDRKKELHLASINASEFDKQFMVEFLEKNLKMNVVSLPNYLCVSLTPSNPILHTTRLYDIFGDNIHVKFNRKILFYREWTDRSSMYLLKADKEFDQLINMMKKNGIDIKGLNNLKTHYGVFTIDEVTKKIRSIQSFSKIESPLALIDNEYIADMNSRYFTEDFEYGLSFLYVYANYFGSEFEMMNEMLAWYSKEINPNFKINFKKNHVELALKMMNLIE